jgi:hypothetical protein
LHRILQLRFRVSIGVTFAVFFGLSIGVSSLLELTAGLIRLKRIYNF